MSEVRCGCHTDIDEAIKAHMGIVNQVLAMDSLNIPRKDIEEARSDGMEALWLGLLSYDPTKMRLLGAYLRTKVLQRVIDGLRSRGIDTRHTDRTNKAKLSIIHADAIDGMEPDEVDALWMTGYEWDIDYHAAAPDIPSRLMVLGWYLDKDLPLILKYTALGYTCPEIQQASDIKSVSRKLQSFKKYAEKFPDLEYRPNYKWINREWRDTSADLHADGTKESSS